MDNKPVKKIEVELNHHLLEGILSNSSPQELSQFIDQLELKVKGPFTTLIKSFTFSKMLQTLNATEHVFKSHLKKGKTELVFSKHNQVILFVSKKDSKDKDDLYARLYHTHKDQLLTLLNSSIKTKGVANHG